MYFLPRGLPGHKTFFKYCFFLQTMFIKCHWAFNVSNKAYLLTALSLTPSTAFTDYSLLPLLSNKVALIKIILLIVMLLMMFKSWWWTPSCKSYCKPHYLMLLIENKGPVNVELPSHQKLQRGGSRELKMNYFRIFLEIIISIVVFLNVSSIENITGNKFQWMKKGGKGGLYQQWVDVYSLAFIEAHHLFTNTLNANQHVAILVFHDNC